MLTVVRITIAHGIESRNSRFYSQEIHDLRSIIPGLSTQTRDARKIIVKFCGHYSNRFPSV